MNLPDPGVEHLEGHGFDPSACQGCPHHEGLVLKTCGLCGCPTGRGFPMAMQGAPPANCPRLEEHAGGVDEEDRTFWDRVRGV